MARAALAGLALVVAGAEARAVAGEDDHLDVTVGVGHVEQAVHLGFERVGERIHALGAIERDGRDLLVHAVQDFLVAHALSFPRSSTAMSTAITPSPARRTMIGLRSSARKLPAWATAKSPSRTRRSASASTSARSRPRTPSSMRAALVRAIMW